MKEIEVKVLEIDLKKTVKKLKKLGAKKFGDYDFFRIIYDFKDRRLGRSHSWVRLRTDGKTTTITYKKIRSKAVDGREEHEIIVDDFQNSKKILSSIGLVEQRVQESRRIMYDLNGVEIDIDLWPMIPPYMEVEAKTKTQLFKTLKKLGINTKDTCTDSGQELYRRYNINLNKYKSLKLEKEKRNIRI